MLAAVAGPARARPPAAAPDAGNFWREVIEPHADEVQVLLRNARHTMREPDNALMTDSDWAVEQRQKFFVDAYNLLRYARKLSPNNVEVLAMFARAADELGKTREAIEALETCIRVTGPDKAGAEVTGRLGAIYLRLGERDTAIRWLRYAQGPLTSDSAPATVHLANALAARGEVGKALDTLHNALPPTAFGYQPDAALVAFALAVLYDRDEQLAAAFEILDRMQASLQQGYAMVLHNELAKLRYAPAEDEHYYLALFYESLGHYVEARAQWALYAASGESPWRARALAHIAAIDHQRRTSPTVKPPTQIKPPPTP